MLGGVFGIWGVALALTVVVFPSAAMWTSGIVCDSPYHLSGGRNMLFECAGDGRSYEVTGPVVGLQALMIALITLVLAVVAAVAFLTWRRLRKRSERRTS